LHAELRAQDPAPPLLGISLIALATLMLQVSLTRVFSLLVWYHFAFLAIAIALLGFTGGGLLTQLRPALRQGDVSRRLAGVCLLFALSTVGSLLFAPRLPFENSVLADAKQIGSFLALIVMFLVPFACAGLVVSLTLATHGASVPRLYFADLVGSGSGCALAVLAMDHLGGGAGGVLASALAGTLAAVAFLGRSPREAPRLWWAAIACAAFIACLIGLARDPLREPFYLPNAKAYPRVSRDAILERKCTSLACVDFFANPLHLGLWGLPVGYRGPLPNQIGVVIDAWALTSIFEAHRGANGAPELGHPILGALPPSLIHHFDYSTSRRADDMLVIGAGGGVDVRAAVSFGVRHVDAVDINPVIIDAVKERYAHYAGDLYARPEVTVTVAEGRHFLRQQSKRYDVIQISGVDTFAASQAGAFALTENYLYTVEAFREFLDHLKPDGTLTLTRWIYAPDRQTVRVCTIADEAMRQLGLGDAAQHIFIAAAADAGAEMQYSVIFLRRMPFRPEEARALRVLVELNGFRTLYSPDDSARPSVYRDYFAAPERAAFVRDYPYRIQPTTDDEPFFFEHTRFFRLLRSRDSILGAASGQMVLMVTLGIMLASAAVFLWLPARRVAAHARSAGSVRVRDEAAPGRLAACWELYFLALGLGFIGVEVALVPRFVLYLGHPVYALTVVLFALLAATGVGSAMSPRVVRGDARQLAAVALAAAVAVSSKALVLGYVFQGTFALPFPARTAMSVGLISGPALLMGMLFPGGLEQAPRGDRRAPWIARAWVLNGWASVVGSVATMILSIAVGFTRVLLVAAAFYGFAAWAARRAAPARTDVG
jgi:spermidine synthase